MDARADLYVPLWLRQANGSLVTEDVRLDRSLPESLTLANVALTRMQVHAPLTSRLQFHLPLHGSETLTSKRPLSAEADHHALTYGMQEEAERAADDVGLGPVCEHAEAIGSTRAPPADSAKALEFQQLYLTGFAALLERERNASLAAFERYSLYEVPVVPSFGAFKALQTATGDIMVPGLRDCVPPIEAGDRAVLRAPGQGVRIVSRVVAVDRAKGVVRIIWYSKPPVSRYNVRFIPSHISHARCLDAVTWAIRLPPAFFAATLFPAEFAEGTDALPRHGASAAEGAAAAAAAAAAAGEAALAAGSPSSTLAQRLKLDDDQQRCVQMVEHRLRTATSVAQAPMLLLGPAGSGKTSTLIESIRAAVGRGGRRALVCAPSHTAADVLCARLAASCGYRPGELLRLCDAARAVETVPAELLPFLLQVPMTGQHRMPTGPEFLCAQVVVCTCLDAALLVEGGLDNMTVRRDREMLVGDALLPTLKAAGLRPHSREPLGAMLGVDQPHFSALFVDEAAQATEPEVLVPLSVVLDPGAASAPLVLMCGDPRQLSPSLCSPRARSSGLALSLLARLLDRPCYRAALAAAATLQQPKPLAGLLSRNYRCVPAVLAMPSTLFYQDRLKSAAATAPDYGPLCRAAVSEACPKRTPEAEELELREELQQLMQLKEQQEPGSARLAQLDKQSSKTRHRLVTCVIKQQELRLHRGAPVPGLPVPVDDAGWPVRFVGVDGHDQFGLDQSTGLESWLNPKEAEVVHNVVAKLHAHGVGTADIGVMAPYRGQVQQLRNLLRGANLGGVNVGTVEDYQAVERDVIVLSITRATGRFVARDGERNRGVMGTAQRANVALTRAKRALVVVGCPALLAGDPSWRQFLLFCERNGLWHGERVELPELAPGAQVRTTAGDDGTRRAEAAQKHGGVHQQVLYVHVSSIEVALREQLQQSGPKPGTDAAVVHQAAELK